MENTAQELIQRPSTNDDDNNPVLFVIKKFINAAIYVEKTIDKATLGSTNYENSLIESQKIMKTKRCSCTVDAVGCAFHSVSASGDSPKNANTVSRSMRKQPLRKLEEFQRDNLKGRLPIEVTKKESICSGTKQSDDRKQQCQNCRNSNEIISSRKTPSKDSIGKRNESNFVKDGKSRRPQMQSKNSNRFISKSSQKVDKSVNSDFINDASGKEKESENAPLKGDDYSHDESSRTTTPLKFSSSSTMNMKKSGKAFTSNLKSEKSLTSLTSFSTSENETIKQWLAEKSEQIKIQANKKLNDERKRIEREKDLESKKKLMREKNFEKWLESKKELENAKKIKETKKHIKTEAKKEIDREEKNLQNHVKYQAWLVKKQQEEKAKQIQEELRKIRVECDREEKISRSQKAYEEWLKSSKNKPKPLPSNKGLDSLRSSLSVKYINPVPWVPNMDERVLSQTEINKKE